MPDLYVYSDLGSDRDEADSKPAHAPTGSG